MDMYKRRRGDWVKKVQGVQIPIIPGASTTPATTSSSSTSNPAVADTTTPPSAARKEKFSRREREKDGAVDTSGKSAIQLAREKFAKQKMEKERKRSHKGTGANGIIA